MNIKHHIGYRLRNQSLLEMRVTFGGDRVEFATGIQVEQPSDWDPVARRLTIPGSEEKNQQIRSMETAVENVFKSFEVQEICPSPGQFKKELFKKIKGAERKEEYEEDGRIQPLLGFFQYFDKFLSESSQMNGWTKSTIDKFKGLRKDLRAFSPNMSFEDINDSWMSAFIVYLRDRKKLQTPRRAKDDANRGEEDLVGLRNATIQIKIKCLKWFLRWATRNGFNTNMAFKDLHPSLRTANKRIFYLTQEELRQIQQFEIPENLRYLEKTRDLLLFTCFSGLRWSDMVTLKKSSIHDGNIYVTTQKMGDEVIIELNSVTREIYEKYKDTAGNDNFFYAPSNQVQNRFLKELCRLAGLDSEVTKTSYKGSQRIDEKLKKWEIVSTHIGRHTFIVQALSINVPVPVVMKWTGHDSYESMKPYVDVADKAKAKEMTKFDNLL